MPQIKCKGCGTLVDYAEGSKPRLFCNRPACRKQASRERKLEEKRLREQQERQALLARWRDLHLHPRTIEVLEMILSEDGLEAAIRATRAIEEECRVIQGLIDKHQQRR